MTSVIFKKGNLYGKKNCFCPFRTGGADSDYTCDDEIYV